MSLTRPLVAAIAERRKALGLTPAEVCRRLDESQHYLRKIENGRKKKISLEDLAAYAKVVGMEVTVSVVIKDGA